MISEVKQATIQYSNMRNARFSSNSNSISRVNTICKSDRLYDMIFENCLTDVELEPAQLLVNVFAAVDRVITMETDPTPRIPFV